jgi:hypothetical protein
MTVLVEYSQFPKRTKREWAFPISFFSSFSFISEREREEYCFDLLTVYKYTVRTTKKEETPPQQGQGEGYVRWGGKRRKQLKADDEPTTPPPSPP